MAFRLPGPDIDRRVQAALSITADRDHSAACPLLLASVGQIATRLQHVPYARGVRTSRGPEIGAAVEAELTGRDRMNDTGVLQWQGGDEVAGFAWSSSRLYSSPFPKNRDQIN
jgi:hypothetical protein